MPSIECCLFEMYIFFVVSIFIFVVCHKYSIISLYLTVYTYLCQIQQFTLLVIIINIFFNLYSCIINELTLGLVIDHVDYKHEANEPWHDYMYRLADDKITTSNYGQWS